MKVFLDHIALNVENVEKAVNFYKTIIGFEIERLEKFEKGIVSFPSVRINKDTVIDLFPPKMWKKEGKENESEKSRLNHLSLTFDEAGWKGLCERLDQNGIEVEKYADNNWGAKGIGISIYFRDPDNNEIEARYYRNE